ncbi:MAG: DUF655 domain-containing protein [Thermoplasmata archaeon]
MEDKHEETVYILDFLPHGRMDAKHVTRESIAYALGENYFKLFELIMNPNVSVNIGDQVYIGKDPTKRKEVKFIKRRVEYEEISSTAQSQLETVIKIIVESHEDRFTKFINTAPAITRKFHTLELLPGIGKKTVLLFVNEIKKAPFKNFKDIEERVGVHDLVNIFTQRIKQEIMDPNEKYHLFVMKQ